MNFNCREEIEALYKQLEELRQQVNMLTIRYNSFFEYPQTILSNNSEVDHQEIIKNDG